MRGKRAKQLRREAYGPDGAPRNRSYGRPTGPNRCGGKKGWRFTRVADPLRQRYQALKKLKAES